MRRPGYILLALVLLSSCVIDAEHVRTKLVKVCTDSVPMIFASSAGLSVASIQVDGVGATVEQPDARASLDSLTLEVLSGLDDFSFAESLSLDFVAGQGALPPARVSEQAYLGETPWVAQGDPSIDVVDYLISEELEMRLEIRGLAPAQSFVASFSACLDVSGIEVEDSAP